MQAFLKFLAVVTPSALYKVETHKQILETRVQCRLWDEGRGLGICELENAPEMQKSTKTFVHDCRFNVLKIDIVLTDVIVMWLFLILDAAPAKKLRKKKKAGPLSRPIICICNDQWVEELLRHDSYGHDYFLQIR